MAVEFIINNGDGGLSGTGSVADRFIAAKGDPRILRPFIGKDNRSYIMQDRPVRNGEGRIVVKEVPVLANNVQASLRIDDWRLIDRAVVEAYKARLSAVADLRNAGLQHIIPNGIAKSTFEYEKVSDTTRATISMDGLRRSEADRPVFESGGIPLPLIHKDAEFPTRQVLISRNGGSPLDTLAISQSTERVAEEVERLLVGTDSYSYGGFTIYGYMNFPHKQTKVITSPLAGGWSPSVLINEVLGMQQQSRNAYARGPWNLYFGEAWNEYLGRDYILTGGNVATQTLRQRLTDIEGINMVKTLDYLPGFRVVLVQTTVTNVRMVVGMEITPVQWDEEGGMKKKFKIMCIIVPQLRADINGNCGLVLGNIAG